MCCFPGGGLEPGESEQEGLRRELREELGVKVDPERRLWQCYSPSGVVLAWWLARLPPGQQLQPNSAEVARAMWLTIPQIRRLPNLLPTNRQFLDAWEG